MSDKCPYTYFSDLIVGETTCDGKKKMYELLGQGKEVYVLHLPQGVEAPYALSMWISELRRFIAYLEEHFQITITDEALRAAIVRRNALRQARCRLMELLLKYYPQVLSERYKVEAEAGTPGYALLEMAGRKRGFLLRGGEVHTERMAKVLMDEFRSGKLGKFTLEMPEEQP